MPEGPDFHIGTQNVDAEIARLAGPQLVVPLSNARYALNAANARWGSLYDAFYGTDAIEETGKLARGASYNATRGARGDRARARGAGSGRAACVGQSSERNRLRGVGQCAAGGAERWCAKSALSRPAQFKGYLGTEASPTALLFEHHGLHIEVRIDRAHPIGRDDPAGIADVQLESALTTIMDLEDSIAAVDSADKVAVYRNWLGLMRGDLTARFRQGQRPCRSQAQCRSHLSVSGGRRGADSRPQPDVGSQRRVT